MMTDAPDTWHLLVVDDEPDAADALAEPLRPDLPGWEVVVACDGASAVERGRHGGFEAAVLDLEMPGPDGLRTAATLRAAARGSALVLTAVSGNAPKLEAARVAGVFDHAMSKPLDVARIEKLLAPIRVRASPAAATVARRASPAATPGGSRFRSLQPPGGYRSARPRSRSGGGSLQRGRAGPVPAPRFAGRAGGRDAAGSTAGRRSPIGKSRLRPPRRTSIPHPTNAMPHPDDPELARWNDRFAAGDYVFGKGPNAFLAAQRGRLEAGQEALCIADGEGRNGVWLASLGLRVTAFDFSPAGAAKAARLAEERGVQVDYRVLDLDRWEWQAERYDVVAAIFVQFATPAQRSRMFEGIVRTLRPGGLLVLQGYRPEQLAYGTGGPKQIDRLYTEELLRESFTPLHVVHLAAHDDALDEGPGHSGMSALIDLLATKDAAPA